ncbi:MAG: hypothetical protein ACTS47_01395 [Candidatus Hodgkinia cicadicola]
MLRKGTCFTLQLSAASLTIERPLESRGNKFEQIPPNLRISKLHFERNANC